MLEELVSFKNPTVKAMFEIYVDQGWFRNLFAEKKWWIEVQCIDDDHMQVNILSRKPISAIPADWEPKGKSQWLVPVNDIGALSEWISGEWLRIWVSKDIRLRMWND